MALPISQEDCSVCLVALGGGAGAVAGTAAGAPGVALLSCAHSFHRACLDSFESFLRGRALGGGGGGGRGGGGGGGAGGSAWPRCPLCRSKYWRA